LPEWARRATDVVNNIMQGRINAQSSVTLTASQATTVVSDRRASAQSVIVFMPTTANAALEVGAGGMYISSRGTETFTITHANNSQNDRTFGYAILG
jgi:hypothetical protein